VTPLEGGYVYTKLTLQTSSSTPLGDYDLTIRGTSGTKTHTVALGLQVINKSSPLPFKCIIATATYGSEMSPEVQYLRGFRDSRILTTITGTEFMKVFNAWYYSFSPYVASWITDNPVSQGPARVVIMPLLGILHLSETAYSALGFAPETATTVAGIIASFLIGMLYFGPILAFAYRLLDQDRFRKVLACGALTLAGCLILLTIGLSALLPTLVMLASSILVLSTVTLGSCSTYMLTSRILSKIRLLG
jgi:peptide/nickel transport system substrate-binding protein